MWHNRAVAHRGQYAVKLGERGRLVLPAAVRRELGVETGERLIVTLEEDGSVRLVNARTLARRLRGLLRDEYPDVDLVEELLSDRSEEVARERESDAGL